MNTKHHTSLKIAKQLAEAGIVIESESQWEVGGKLSGKQNATLVLRNRPPSFVSADSAWSFYPAPIATELLERLPAELIVEKVTYNLFIGVAKTERGIEYYVGYADEFEREELLCELQTATIPNALALLLIRLTKDGLI